MTRQKASAATAADTPDGCVPEGAPPAVPLALLPVLAQLLDEPAPGGALDAQRAAAEHLVAAHPAAGACAFALVDGLAAHPSPAGLHARTFDLMPACTPYLSVHLFGVEARQRAELMAGLAAAWARVGVDPGGELPDHLVVVLRGLSALSPEERDELLSLCLRPALAKMRQALAGTDNPYRHALAAVAAAVGASEEAPAPGRPDADTAAPPETRRD